MYTEHKTIVAVTSDQIGAFEPVHNFAEM